MRYEKVIKAEFIERPNRFVAVVRPETDGEVKGEGMNDAGTIRVHVKNTGRCGELLVSGATVYLEDFEGRMGTRKMRYSLVGVEKQVSGGVLLVNMDSQAPNKVVREALDDLKSGSSRSSCSRSRLTLPNLNGEITLVKSEQTFEGSRFDFYVETAEDRAYIEVKGVTLEDRGFASFPDAPTDRGVRHIRELIRAAEQGYKAYVLFVIQMKGMHTFGPNRERHPEFAEVLSEAYDKGVNILAYDCVVAEDGMELYAPVPVEL
ncbi:MAG: DNA/RNA nuclease SfsA [Lentihominibacter sp.]|jgi:sugar fermentation stimulation protein A